MTVYAVTYDSKSSYITNGKRYRVERDDGRGLFNIRSNRGAMLTCLWEGCAHLGTRGNWTRIEEEEQVTLLPGDYVSTEGMTEGQYHAVARAFASAGCPRFDDRSWMGTGDYLEWWKGELVSTSHVEPGGRHLTPAQVIGAVNAGSQQGEDSRAQYRAVRSPFFSDGSIVEVHEYDTDGSSLFRLVSGECKYNNAGGLPGAWDSFNNMELINMNDTLTQTLRDAAEHDEKAKHHAEEHGRLMQQARDMLPDGWRLVKSEDMVETLSVDANPFIKGMTEDPTDPANWREGILLKW